MQHTRRWQKAAAVFDQIGARENCDPTLLLGIYTLESYYRPLNIRLAEYAMLLGEGLLCPFRGGQIRNYTIGPCQIGLSTLLRYRHCSVELHCKRVPIPSVRAYLSLFRAASIAYSAGVLSYRLGDAMQQAKQNYPGRFHLQCRYVGEAFNGRYSYGLLLEQACRFICSSSMQPSCKPLTGKPVSVESVTRFWKTASNTK